MSRAALAFCLPLLVAASPGHAQLRPEARADVIGARTYRVHPGVGVVTAAGNYARLGAVVGYAATRDSTLMGGRWRAEVLARITLDPFAQRRWGLSFGTGLSVRRRPYLALFAELEGPALGAWRPAVHAGVSGGVRGGLLLRRAMTGRR